MHLSIERNKCMHRASLMRHKGNNYLHYLRIFKLRLHIYYIYFHRLHKYAKRGTLQISPMQRSLIPNQQKTLLLLSIV